jgi:hypothetical protein
LKTNVLSFFNGTLPTVRTKTGKDIDEEFRSLQTGKTDRDERIFRNFSRKVLSFLFGSSDSALFVYIIYKGIMFAKPSRKKRSKGYPGVGALAKYILSPKKSSVGIDTEAPVSASSTVATKTTVESNATASTLLSRISADVLVKTGDNRSFWTSSNDTSVIAKGAAMKGYRVLAVKTNKKGKRVVYDILDGTKYYCGSGVQRRITSNAIVFPTKEAALSERFPSNQVKHCKHCSL